MAYEFKKLSEVDAIEAMSDSTNVIVEENGEIVKLPANSMVPEDVALKSDIPQNIVKSVNWKTPDSNGNVYVDLNINEADPNIYYCNLDEDRVNSYLTLYWDNGYADGEGGPVWDYNFDLIVIGKDIIEYGWDGYLLQSIILGKCDETCAVWFTDINGDTHEARAPHSTEQ